MPIVLRLFHQARPKRKRASRQELRARPSVWLSLSVMNGIVANLLIALSCFLVNRSAIAQLPTIELRSLSQSFFRPGGEYNVNIAEGSNTEEIGELVFSHPGITAALLRETGKPFSESDSPRHGHFKVTVRFDVPQGRYEVRAVGRFGISNPRSIVVRSNVQIATTGVHDSKSATPISTGEQHCRHVTPAQRDFYALDVSKGQRYQVQVSTHVADSRIIEAVSIARPNGQTMQSVIGSDLRDLQFAFVAKADETLTIAIHDALFRGGPSFQYGLEIIGADVSTSTTPPLQFSTLLPPAMMLNGENTVAIAPEISEVPLKIPSAVHANFESVDDRHHYVCTLTKGNRVRIGVVSEREGQPTDIRLTVDRAVDAKDQPRTWKRVATADDSQNLSDSVIRLYSKDPVLFFQPPEDGDYRITVSDLDNGQSQSAIKQYKLSLEPARSRWQLLTYPVYPHKDAKTTRPRGIHLPKGASTTIRVFVIREEMRQPIKVTATGLPEGVQCVPSWIGANQNQTDLTLTAVDSKSTEWSDIEITGEAKIGDSTENRIAKAATVTWEQDGYRPTCHTRLTDSIAISTTDLDVYPISIRNENSAAVTAEKGKNVSIPIKLERQEGAKQSVLLRAKNLPPGVKAADLTIPADKSEAKWEIEITPSAATGSYAFWGQGETKVKFAVNPQKLARETEYRDHLKMLRADVSRASDHDSIDKAVAESDKRIQTLKKQTAPRDFTVYVPTTLITLDIQ